MAEASSPSKSNYRSQKSSQRRRHTQQQLIWTSDYSQSLHSPNERCCLHFYIVSKRWKNRWSSLSKLSLHQDSSPSFVRFVNQVLLGSHSLFKELELVTNSVNVPIFTDYTSFRNLKVLKLCGINFKTDFRSNVFLTFPLLTKFESKICTWFVHASVFYVHTPQLQTISIQHDIDMPYYYKNLLEVVSIFVVLHCISRNSVIVYFYHKTFQYRPHAMPLLKSFYMRSTNIVWELLMFLNFSANSVNCVGFLNACVYFNWPLTSSNFTIWREAKLSVNNTRTHKHFRRFTYPLTINNQRRFK